MDNYESIQNYLSILRTFKNSINMIYALFLQYYMTLQLSPLINFIRIFPGLVFQMTLQ